VSGHAKGVVLGAGSALLVLSLLACSWLASPQGSATVAAGVDLAVCVLNHAQDPIATIVSECGADSAESVVKILDASIASAVRAGCALRPDGGL
jgi:hypothetical protein